MVKLRLMVIEMGTVMVILKVIPKVKLMHLVTNWVTDLVKLMETHLAILMLMVIGMVTVMVKLTVIPKVILRLMVTNWVTVKETLKVTVKETC